jgi:peptidoglycan/xylan/chitin deacetylase (PgdA/CDA1 family)
MFDATPRPAEPTALVLPSPDTLAVQRYIRSGFAIYCGGGARRVVALTFDDGPGPFSDELLNLLQRRRASATFFSVGRNVAARPEITARQAEIGAVGDHTWSHISLVGLRPSRVARQLRRTRDEITRASGSGVSLFRPPYGARTASTMRIARRLGLLEVLWSVDSRDWQFRRQRRIRAILRAGLRPGAIVLLHEHDARTLPTISWLLTQLHRRNLTPVTIPELLALDPPSRAQLEADARGSACVRFP